MSYTEDSILLGNISVRIIFTNPTLSHVAQPEQIACQAADHHNAVSLYWSYIAIG